MSAGKEIKRLRGNVSATMAASLIGVDVERLRKWELRDADPKDTGDIKAIEDYFGCPIKDLSSLDNFQFVKKNKIHDVKVEDPNALHVIYLLAENNKTLSESNKVLVESNKVLADSNQELVLLAKQAFNLNLEKLLKDGQLPPHLNKEHSKAPSERLPLRSRLANKNKTEAAGK